MIQKPYNKRYNIKSKSEAIWGVTKEQESKDHISNFCNSKAETTDFLKDHWPYNLDDLGTQILYQLITLNDLQSPFNFSFEFKPSLT